MLHPRHTQRGRGSPARCREITTQSNSWMQIRPRQCGAVSTRARCREPRLCVARSHSARGEKLGSDEDLRPRAISKDRRLFRTCLLPSLAEAAAKGAASKDEGRQYLTPLYDPLEPVEPWPWPWPWSGGAGFVFDGLGPELEGAAGGGDAGFGGIWLAGAAGGMG